MPKRMKLMRPDWPDADRHGWDQLVKRGCLFEPSGALAHWRDTSRRSREDSYGLWLAWIGTTDPGALDLAPSERASAERLVAWLTTMSHLQPITRLSRFLDVSKVVGSLDPAWRTKAHRHIERRLRFEAQGVAGPRKYGRILAGEVLVGRCLQELDALWQQGPTREVALKVRDVTLLFFLASLPPRRKNLASLALGETLHRADATWRVDFPAGQMKSGRPFNAELPAGLASVLTRYVDVYRPLLVAPEAGPLTALWIGDRGHGWAAHTLALRVCQITKERFGIPISPHLFRDCAATTMILASPQHAALAPALLGHHTAETSQQHYLRARGIEAGRSFAEIVTNLKRSQK